MCIGKIYIFLIVVKRRKVVWDNLIIVNYNIIEVIIIDFDCFIFILEEGIMLAFFLIYICF